VDFVSPAALDLAHLRHYRIVFLPYPVMLSESTGNLIREYIEGGGTVVAEARLAWNDERGHASPVIPGFGLDRVFGARETVIRPEDKPEIVVQAAAALPGVAEEARLPGAAFEEDLEPLAGARTLATFASGAIVSNHYGSGTAILAGTFLGLSYQRVHDPSTRDLIVALAQAAGVEQEVSVAGSGTDEIEVRRLIGENDEMVFIFNHSDQPADAAVSLHLPWKPTAARDVVEDSPVTLEDQKGAAVLHQLLPPQGFRVVSLERR